MPSKANWSLEVFNGFAEGSLNETKSLLLGARIILSPFEGLDFELVQTSQWGGKGYSTGISALGAALFFDTNDNSNSNINKMAGFGISYLIPSNIIPLRIYGQAVGEDEAGNLPSCYAYLAGVEWSNTIYNNGTYDYINYGDTMGAAIDTEGNSLELFGQSQISQKISIKYSTKLVTINDKNSAGHRLSSKRQSGLINSLGASWNKNNIRFNVNIYDQGFTLDKASIKSSSGVGFSSSIIF